MTGRRHRTGRWRWRWAAACLLALAAGATGCGRLPEPSPEARAWAAGQRTNEGTTQRTTERTTDAAPSPKGPAPAGASGREPLVNQPMAPAPANAQPPATDLGPPGSALAESEAWTGQLPPGAVALADEAARPVRVRVAALGVDAPVVVAGVAADGQLELPADAATVAWFIGGAVPGDSGSAVLAAHVDLGGVAGAFFDLASLPAGSDIDIVFPDGGVRTFRTSAGSRAHVKADLPIGELFRRGGEPALTLVTCGGPFDPVARSYAENTVVSATPASPA